MPSKQGRFAWGLRNMGGTRRKEAITGARQERNGGGFQAVAGD